MTTVYLAGAIDRVSAEYATGWRQKAKRILREVGLDVIDPTEGKELEREDVNTTLYTPAEIVETDLRAIERSDVLLVEMSRDDIPYIGTSMEIRQAYVWGKKIVVWGNPTSYWVRYHADYICEGLDEAIEWIKQNVEVSE